MIVVRRSTLNVLLAFGVLLGVPAVSADPEALSDGDTRQVHLAEGEEVFYTIEVPAGTDLLSAEISGDECTTFDCPSDADLQLRFGAEPSDTDNDCWAAELGSNDACDIVDPAAGTWYIRLVGRFLDGDVTLRVDLDLPDQDGDGTPDARDADRDGDGFDNDTETLLGSDPDDPASPTVGGPSCIDVAGLGIVQVCNEVVFGPGSADVHVEVVVTL